MTLVLINPLKRVAKYELKWTEIVEIVEIMECSKVGTKPVYKLYSMMARTDHFWRLQA